MEKPIFLLLGGNKLNYGVLKKFQNKGYYVIVVDWNENPCLVGNMHLQIDVKDSARIIQCLREKNLLQNVKFCYSSIDLAVPSVANINKEIGLRTISDEGIFYAGSKSRMISKWGKDGLLNRVSLSFNHFDNTIIDLNKTKKIIIKPDDSASSRGITVVEKESSLSELKKAYQKAEKEATNNIVVVEEYVNGTEFTVEMIGDDEGNVTVYGISRKSHTNYTENNKIAVKLHYNSVSDNLQRKIAEFGIKCYKSLGFINSLGHLEVLLKDDGTISPVEIGARSSGYIASDLVDIVSGVGFLEELIAVQKGKPLKNCLHSQTDFSSMYFFYDFPPGKEVKKETNLLAYCDDSIISRYHDRNNIIIGKCFNIINNDNSRWGYEILQGPKRIMTKESIEKAEKSMLLDMFGGIK